MHEELLTQLQLGLQVALLLIPATHRAWSVTTGCPTVPAPQQTHLSTTHCLWNQAQYDLGLRLAMHIFVSWSSPCAMLSSALNTGDKSA